jgi:hypothetical protein
VETRVNCVVLPLLYGFNGSYREEIYGGLNGKGVDLGLLNVSNFSFDRAFSKNIVNAWRWI